MLPLNQWLLAGKLLLLSILVCWNLQESNGFVPNALPLVGNKVHFTDIIFLRHASAADGIEKSDPEEIENEEGPSQRFKDVNEMTDRFKYKVHALMGDYDPTEGMVDDESQDGNIMKALLKFPTQHVFDVVGKVSAESDANGEDYADKVKSIVFDNTGDDEIKCEIIPRGKKFVKVRCEAKVESTTMINNIYDELGEMESTVMKF